MANNPYADFDTGAGQPVQQYKKVATAPDGVPVYQNGGNYYTQNADQSYTQQFQGGTPDWLNQQSGGQQQPQTGGIGAGQSQSGQIGAPPSYYNAQDPVHQAVWNAFQAKGIQPRDQADFQYWVDHINNSGGLENGYQNTGGTGTWADRMASGNGGVGDYRTGGAPINGGTMGDGGFNGPMGTLFSGGGNPLGAGDARSLYEKLMGRANESLSLDPTTDSIIRPQVDAFDADRQRQDKNTLSQLAEQAGPNSNLSAATRAAGEASGQATSSYQAGLASNEVAARRQEIAQALQLGAGLLTQEQQMALTEELHNLDLQQNAYQFDINDQYRNSPLAWA